MSMNHPVSRKRRRSRSCNNSGIRYGFFLSPPLLVVVFCCFLVSFATAKRDDRHENGDSQSRLERLRRRRRRRRRRNGSKSQKAPSMSLGAAAATDQQPASGRQQWKNNHMSSLTCRLLVQSGGVLYDNHQEQLVEDAYACEPISTINSLEAQEQQQVSPLVQVYSFQPHISQKLEQLLLKDEQAINHLTVGTELYLNITVVLAKLAAPNAEEEGLLQHSIDNSAGIYLSERDATLYFPSDDSNFAVELDVWSPSSPLRSQRRQLVNTRKEHTDVTSGARRLCVLRISTWDAQCSYTATQIQQALFDWGSVSLASHYYDCSLGNVWWESAGVHEVLVDGYKSDYDSAAALRNAALNKFANHYAGGAEACGDNVAVVLPPGLQTTKPVPIASAATNHWLSTFLDAWIMDLRAVCHELGHNVGLGHAREAYNVYGDETSMMAATSRPIRTNGPRRCWNGANDDVLGWYRGLTHSIDPASATQQQTIFLCSFVDYNKCLQQQSPVLIKIVGTNSIVLKYNDASGPNVDTGERADQVTLTQQVGNPTTLLAGLAPGTTHVIRIQADLMTPNNNQGAAAASAADNGAVLVVEACQRIVPVIEQEPKGMIISWRYFASASEYYSGGNAGLGCSTSAGSDNQNTDTTPPPPQPPMQPDNPLPPPLANDKNNNQQQPYASLCISHPRCAGLSGECCPTRVDMVYLACCDS